jgi:hypothetical protein
VTILSSHLKGTLIALVALALSAGVAFAGSSHGLSVAATHAGKTVPVVVSPTEPEDVNLDEVANEDDQDVEDATETEVRTEDASDSADNCTTDPTGMTAEQLAELTHGQVVCWAAHQDTPDGYANHGAWVSEWAKKDTGGEDAATTAKTTHAAKGLAHKGQGKGNRP